MARMTAYLTMGFLLAFTVLITLFGADASAISLDANDAEMPRIVSLRLDPASLNLVFQVEGGAFDPIISVSPIANNLFKIEIEGEGVQLGSALAYESKALTQHLISSIKEVQSAQLSQSGSAGQPGFKLSIQVKQRIQPQIRSNTGSLVTLSLQGATASHPVGQGRVVQSQGNGSRSAKRETQIELPPITFDSSREPADGLDTLNNDSALTMSPVGPSVPASYSAFTQGQQGFSIYEAIQNPTVDGVIRQAWGEYRQGRLNSGQMMLESYLGKRPKDKLARYLLAVIHLAGDESQRATMALQKTLKIDESFLPAWIDLVRLNLKEGNFSETEELLEQALVKFPAQADLLYAKGLLLEAQGNVPQAKDFYLRVLAKDSRHWMAHYRLAITELKSNQPQAAVVELKRILNANPDDIASLKALGYAYHRDNNVTKAMASYRQALKPDVLINFAGLLREQNQEADALALYGAAEVIALEDADIQYNLGMLYADMNQEKPAVRSLSRFVELARSNPKGFLGDDQRVTRATAKLRAFGVNVPQAEWLQNASSNAKEKELDYEFGVSSTE